MNINRTITTVLLFIVFSAVSCDTFTDCPAVEYTEMFALKICGDGDAILPAGTYRLHSFGYKGDDRMWTYDYELVIDENGDLIMEDQYPVSPDSESNVDNCIIVDVDLGAHIRYDTWLHRLGQGGVTIAEKETPIVYNDPAEYPDGKDCSAVWRPVPADELILIVPSSK